MTEEQQRIAAIEARNALLQFNEVRRLFFDWEGDLRLTPTVICELNRIAVHELEESAGMFRTESVVITHSAHQPPPCEQIPQLVAEMCDYANSRQDEPLHASSYLMWRLNWIHPFLDGNGRTARVISYLALNCGYKRELPGQLTVPELIIKQKKAYYIALDAADAAWRRGVLDVSIMAYLIESLLKQQLASV